MTLQLYTLIFLLLYGAYVYSVKFLNESDTKKINYLCITLLILISAFRWKVGGDWDAYYGISRDTNDVKKVTFSWSFVYSLINYIFYKIKLGIFGVNILKVEGINLRDDLDEIASLCKALTGVISPSTTTAHLSGCMGTKTIIIDRTTNWSPKINNFDAVLPSIQHIFPPQVGDWNWVFKKARSVAQGWIQDEIDDQIIP